MLGVRERTGLGLPYTNIIIRKTCGGEQSQIDSPWPSFCPNLKGEGRNESEPYNRCSLVLSPAIKPKL